jgi:aconitate hydratase
MHSKTVTARTLERETEWQRPGLPWFTGQSYVPGGPSCDDDQPEVDVTSKDPVNSFGARDTLTAGGKSYEMYRLHAVPGDDQLPHSLKALAENLLRTEDGANITKDHIEAIDNCDPDTHPSEIHFTPARVIIQDCTGVPCNVDLATLREAVGDLGGNPEKVNPLATADLVIDHS